MIKVVHNKMSQDCNLIKRPENIQNHTTSPEHKIGCVWPLV